MKEPTLYGIDGCRGGWVVAGSDSALRHVSLAVLNDLRALFRIAGSHVVIAIDIPIGLPVNEARACDREARKILGVRRSSVFSPPARSALSATNYRIALRLNRRTLGTGISKQAFHIMQKIGELLSTVQSSGSFASATPKLHSGN